MMIIVRRLFAPEMFILQSTRDLLNGDVMQTSPVRLFFVELPDPFVLCMAIIVQRPAEYDIHRAYIFSSLL